LENVDSEMEIFLKLIKKSRKREFHLLRAPFLPDCRENTHYRSKTWIQASQALPVFNFLHISPFENIPNLPWYEGIKVHFKPVAADYCF
jgi:hypothetical protein